jgi:hypothetical protein
MGLYNGSYGVDYIRGYQVTEDKTFSFTFKAKGSTTTLELVNNAGYSEGSLLNISIKEAL